jgi:hypothetical protein
MGFGSAGPLPALASPEAGSTSQCPDQIHHSPRTILPSETNCPSAPPPPLRALAGRGLLNARRFGSISRMLARQPRLGEDPLLPDALLFQFLARIPVSMYATDFREEALEHVIESLDPGLFERVTGLKIEDFKTLSDLGLFNTARMDAAIYQFRQFERASLEYTEIDALENKERRVGLWDRTMRE